MDGVATLSEAVVLGLGTWAAARVVFLPELGRWLDRQFARLNPHEAAIRGIVSELRRHGRHMRDGTLPELSPSQVAERQAELRRLAGSLAGWRHAAMWLRGQVGKLFGCAFCQRFWAAVLVSAIFRGGLLMVLTSVAIAAWLDRERPAPQRAGGTCSSAAPKPINLASNAVRAAGKEA